MKKNLIKHINQFKSLTKPKILIQRAERLGDLVLVLPVIETLRHHFPDALIYVLCSSRNKQLLYHYPIIDEFISFDIHLSPSAADKQTFIKFIKDHKFDLYIAFWGEPFFQKLGFLASIPLSFGPHINPLSSFFYSKSITLPWHDIFIHESDFNFKCIEPLQLKPVQSLTRPQIQPASSITAKILDRINLLKKTTVLFFCSSGKPETSIDEHTYLSIANSLCEQGFHVLLTYGNLDSFKSIQYFEHPNLTNITDELSLNELIQLIDTIDIYFGPDTGPSHIASLFNKKVVLLYKSSNNPPLRWGPLCQQFSIIRFDYLSNSSIKNALESNTSIQAIYDINQTNTQLSDSDIKRIHSKTSLRFIWTANNKDQFKAEKEIIQILKQQGWVIFVHIKRPNPLKNIVRLLQKYRQRHINAFYSNSNSIYFYPIRFLLHSQLRPKLVIRSKPSLSKSYHL